MTAEEKYVGKLEGKVALVTGGNSGIGLATAKQFVNEGAYVFITGRRESELAAAVKEVGRNITAVRGDVSNLDDLDRLFAQIKREKGRLDIVFANAGVAKLAPLGTITEEFYDSIFNVNVKGLLFTVQKALPLLPDGCAVHANCLPIDQSVFRQHMQQPCEHSTVSLQIDQSPRSRHRRVIRCHLRQHVSQKALQA